jgi:hypothetical protein
MTSETGEPVPHLGNGGKAAKRPRVRTREAAKYVGSATSTLEKLRIYGGGPPFYRLGPKIVVYDLDDLDEWIEAGRHRSTSDSGTAVAATA